MTQFRFSSDARPDGQMAQAFFPLNSRSLNTKAFARVASRLIANTDIGHNEVALVVPFFTTKEHKLVSLKRTLRAIPERLSRATDLPFTGCLVLILPLKELTCQRISHVKLVLERIATILDSYSHQRLQFRIFNRAIELIAESETERDLFKACEFAALQVFGAEGALAWVIPAVGSRPIFRSRSLALAAVPQDQASIIESAINEVGSIYYRRLDEVPQFFKDTLKKAIDSRPSQLSQSGVSGFCIIFKLQSKNTFLVFLRDRPHKATSWEHTALKSFAVLLRQKASYLSTRSREPLKAMQSDGTAVDSGLHGPFNRLSLVASRLEALNLKTLVGFLLFTYDEDAQVLCFEGGEHYQRQRLNTGADLPADESTLAALTIRGASSLLGVRDAKNVQCYDAATKKFVALVPYLGWLPGASGFIAQPIQPDSSTKLVIVVGFKRMAIRDIAFLSSEYIAAAAQSISEELRYRRAIDRVKLRDKVLDAERRLAEFDIETTELRPSIENVPPEIADTRPKRFCELMSQLLAEYARHFGWLSISLRVVDWFGDELCRIAGTGPIGFKIRHNARPVNSTISYCLNHCKPGVAVSIPNTKQINTTHKAYPCLVYKESRPGVVSELCFPLFDSDGRRMGTLNFESTTLRDFVVNRWACRRIHEDVQHSLNLQLARTKGKLQSVLHGLRSYLGFIHHEVKNLANPLLSGILKQVRSQNEQNESGVSLSVWVENQQHYFQKKINSLTFSKEELFSVHPTINQICSLMEDRLRSPLGEAGINITHHIMGHDARCRLNVAVLEMCIDTLIRDVVTRHLEKGRRGRSIRVVSVVTSEHFSIHIGQNGGRLPKVIARRLFWFKRPATGYLGDSTTPIRSRATRNNTGVGAYFLGLFLRSIGLYPKGGRDIPKVLIGIKDSDVIACRCWFSLYGRLELNP